ncbi:MAG: DUF2066 domain-containing protein [Pseudomonadota bacterium]|nr:DUF2066 domain-containing protein [Pseudomonadota bacterium]
MMKILYVIALILCMGIKMAWADLYRVEGIPISAELNTVKEARTMAIENGEIDAFWALMKKMVNEEYLQQVPMPPEGEIPAWVQTVSLSNEKHTNTKYMADLSVLFDETKIQAFLTQNSIPFLTKDMPNMVIVPILYGKENEEMVENPMQAYLTENPIKNELWNASVIMGDLEEIALIHNAVQENDFSQMSGLADKYGASSVMIVQVKQNGPYVVADVSYVPPQPILDNRVEMIVKNGQIQSAVPNLWHKIVQMQEQKWREAKTQNFEGTISFWVQVPIRTLREWTSLYSKLKQADFLDSLAVRGFRPNEVWVTFAYRGSSSDLNRQLRPLGLELNVGDQNGVWQLVPKRGI